MQAELWGGYGGVYGGGEIPMRDIDVVRFHSRYIPVPESGCWLWLGPLHKTGYALFYWNGKQSYAHRFSHEAFKGQIHEGLQIDHLCRVQCCVNPDHLEAVTLKVNVLRGISPIANNSRETHCPAGHAYSYENTYVPPSGGRYCRSCMRLANKDKAARRKEERHRRGARKYVSRLTAQR